MKVLGLIKFGLLRVLCVGLAGMLIYQVFLVSENRALAMEIQEAKKHSVDLARNSLAMERALHQIALRVKQLGNDAPELEEILNKYGLNVQLDGTASQNPKATP